MANKPDGDDVNQTDRNESAGSESELGPLRGVRVVDLTDGLSGPYCTKLLSDAGADVVVAERPGGAPGRDDASAFSYLHAGKRSVRREECELLLETADIIVVDAEFDVERARRRQPWQVVLSISPFGRTGPWVGRPANEFTMQAACGSTGGRGLPGEEPLSAGGRLGEWLAGVYAAVAATAAYLGAGATGHGELIDVAVFDCMAIGMVTFPSVFADFAATCGAPPVFSSSRKIEVPSIEPTRDGWVTITTNSGQQFADFVGLIGHPELADDDRYRRAGARFDHRDEFLAMTHAYTLICSRDDLIDIASAMRIPIAPVLDARQVMECDHFVERSVFVERPGDGARQPRVPYEISGFARRPISGVPTYGADDGTIDWTPHAGRTVGSRSRPLDGVRVVDLTAWWAGPSSTHALACLGADVIKVESPRRPDLMRFSGPRSADDPQWFEWSPLVHAVNTNKRAITIDLASPDGRELLLDLLSTADLLIENFTPRVMEQLDLDWETLRERCPRLGMVRMPGFGLDGPWRDRPGFAQTMESVSGLAWLTGHESGPPVLVGGVGDPIAGMHATFAALLALQARELDGVGHHVESTMVESVLNVAAVPILDMQHDGVVPTRRGNGSSDPGAWQAVVRCSGVDSWLAVSASDPSQQRALWRHFVPVGPVPNLAAMPIEVVDGAKQCDAVRLAEELCAAGVPAAVAIVPAEIVNNVQVRHRGLFEIEEHSITGDHRLPGMPFRFESIPRWLETASPRFGEHNSEVLTELGIDEPRRSRLYEEQVVSDRLLM